MEILNGIKTSSDVKKLSVKELEQLSKELRDRIFEVTKSNGGHLSSNLGVTDLTTALYSVFDFPKDKLIFDVGHQCYAHKMLSGRNDLFDKARTADGISGFPNKFESEYDTFTVGHAGTSIASSLGVCSARDAKGEDYFVINVVGDGSFVNGLNLEAFYAKTFKPKKLIVILNDNGMSISKNKNGFYKFLNKRTLGKGYRSGKGVLKKIFGESFITKFLRKVKNTIKRLFNRNVHLENFGFKYVGVIDGNDMKELIKVLNSVKRIASEKAVLLHVKTTKGLGFNKTEADSGKYHGVGIHHEVNQSAFSQTVGKAIDEIIERDPSVVAITAGMTAGTGLLPVEKNHPNNFFDVGIAEEYAVTFSAGLSAGGLKPIVCIYSTFLQRAYDQILHDVCLQSLPVVFLIDRAGLVGADGETHQGVFDLSYLSHLPNVKIFAPSTESELVCTLKYALTLSCPVAIRYPNGNGYLDREFFPYEQGLWEEINEGKDITVLAVGPRTLNIAKEYANRSKKSVRVISARTIKPLDEKILKEISTKPIMVLEENSEIGGLSSLVMDYYAKENIQAIVKPFGIKDAFVSQGTVAEQLEENGITVEKLIENE